ncbi:hypothetical protein AVEN_12519-1 [Araneus ventricosus]|uniref:Uncharacterized protein n=1 Tax=Araneus ventricosus TaxID=182803 RepID=A0A4Y2IML9_ARAVE|nr:hypothetical protein AVEN_12519-1 [Araneus ventricosus]
MTYGVEFTFRFLNYVTPELVKARMFSEEVFRLATAGIPFYRLSLLEGNICRNQYSTIFAFLKSLLPLGIDIYFTDCADVALAENLSLLAVSVHCYTSKGVGFHSPLELICLNFNNLNHQFISLSHSVTSGVMDFGGIVLSLMR